MRTKRGKDPVQIQLIGRSRKLTQSATATSFLRGKIDGGLILWSTLFVWAITSTALFGLGYARSPHLQGSTNDPDFWFLIQGSVVQLLGLVISALLERKNGNLPVWRWVFPTGIAGVCSITAIPLYLVAPTEWSSFLSLAASSAQSFMVWQHFLSESASE